MTTMSLVESKRGISEAESVTKLTELSFPSFRSLLQPAYLACKSKNLSLGKFL